MSGDKGTRKIGRARDRNRITELPLTESISNDWHRLDLLYATSDVRISLSPPPPFPLKPAMLRAFRVCEQRVATRQQFTERRRNAERQEEHACLHASGAKRTYL